MKYDRVNLLSAPAEPSMVPALIVPSLSLGLVSGAFVGLAAHSRRAGIITGVAVGAATAAALGLFFFVFKGAVDAAAEKASTGT